MKPLGKDALRRVGRILTGPPEADEDSWSRAVEEAAKDPRNLLGRYVLLQEVGRGATGRVYRAFDRTLRRLAAVKVISVPAGTDVRALEREFVAMAQLRHPNIVAIYDAGVHGDRLYSAMEWMEDGPLRGPMEPARAVRIVRAIASALDAAHAAGLVHQDVKPSNILMSGDVPKLADFGAVRRLLPIDDTTAPVTKGTPGFMAPEQASGRRSEVDQRTDVFGLGATLDAICASKDARLRKIIARAKDPDRSRRYASAAEFARDLEVWERRFGWQAPAIAAAVVAVLVIVALAWPRPKPPSPAAAPPELRTRLKEFRYHRQHPEEFRKLFAGLDFRQFGEPMGPYFRRLAEEDLEARCDADASTLPREFVIVRGIARVFDAQVDGARSDLRRFPEDPQARLALAVLELFESDPHDVLAMLRGLEGPDARRIEAACHAILGDYAKALGILETLRGDLPEVLSDIGTCRFATRDDAAAEREYRACLERAPGCYVANYQLAVVLGRLGRVGEAIDALERTLRRARDEGDLSDETIEEFTVEARLGDCFIELPRAFVERDPELDPVRKHPDFERRIRPLLK